MESVNGLTIWVRKLITQWQGKVVYETTIASPIASTSLGTGDWNGVIYLSDRREMVNWTNRVVGPISTGADRFGNRVKRYGVEHFPERSPEQHILAHVEHVVPFSFSKDLDESSLPVFASTFLNLEPASYKLNVQSDMVSLAENLDLKAHIAHCLAVANSFRQKQPLSKIMVDNFEKQANDAETLGSQMRLRPGLCLPLVAVDTQQSADCVLDVGEPLNDSGRFNAVLHATKSLKIHDGLEQIGRAHV